MSRPTPYEIERDPAGEAAGLVVPAGSLDLVLNPHDAAAVVVLPDGRELVVSIEPVVHVPDILSDLFARHLSTYLPMQTLLAFLAGLGGVLRGALSMRLVISEPRALPAPLPAPETVESGADDRPDNLVRLPSSSSRSS